MNAEFKIAYSDYHNWYVQIVKGGVIANGFKSQEAAEKWLDNPENRKWAISRIGN